MASKRKSTAIITRSKKLKPCSVGTCGDVDEYNLCRFRRPPGVNINKFEFNPTKIMMEFQNSKHWVQDFLVFHYFRKTRDLIK